jgi:predicted PolB exonuclease-like 3'-5' exonuclease
MKLEQILFLDIETVPLEASFGALSEEAQQLFADKTQYQRKDEISPKEFYERAGIWAEFGKIVCISAGYFVDVSDKRSFRMTSFYGEELNLLNAFKALLDQHFSKRYHKLCAHNGKEFDFPYIARRMLVHDIRLPNALKIAGKKPWEVPHLDTLELWKFGDYKHYTSLKLLTNTLGIPSPKDDMDGSQVADVFYNKKDIDRIVAYCEHDVVAVAQILLKFEGWPLLTEDEVVHVNSSTNPGSKR